MSSRSSSSSGSSSRHGSSASLRRHAHCMLLYVREFDSSLVRGEGEYLVYVVGGLV